MPAECLQSTTCSHHRSKGRLVLLVLLATAATGAGQTGNGSGPSGKDAPRAAALKLTDGTIILLTKSPNEVNPPIDGVMLSGKEYQALLEQIDQAKKAKDNNKTIAPSSCHIQGKVTAAGKQAVGSLTLTYEFQVSDPGATVALGCSRGFPRSAKFADGSLPILRADKDGLSVLVVRPGEYKLTIDLDVAVSTRGASGDLGFDIGLPRAPITTLSLTAPRAAAKEITVGTRSPDRPTEVRRATYSTDRLSQSSGVALGPTELLEVYWEVPSTPTPASDLTLSAETEVTVQVDEVLIESEAKIRLRGVAKEWPLVFPSGAEVSVERSEIPAGAELAADLGFPLASPTLIPPKDPSKPIWTLRPPEGSSAEWTVTAIVRQPRPKPTEAKFRGPYPIGPFAVPESRQTATIRVSAPTTVRTAFKHGPDVRRQDLPTGAVEDLAAVFRFADAPRKIGKTLPSPWLEIDATQAVGFVRVEPTYQVRLTANGTPPTSANWRLEAKLRVTPIRSEINQIVVDLPASWDKFEAGPLDVVDGVVVSAGSGEIKRYTIRLFASHRKPFDLTLSANHPVESGARDITLPMPSYPQAIEQGSKVLAAVPPGLTLRGNALGGDQEQFDTAIELSPTTPSSPSAAVTELSAGFSKGVGKVTLAWSPFRPDLPVVIETEVTLTDRQAHVEQTFRFDLSAGVDRPIRFRGPDEWPPNLRFTPAASRDVVDGDLIFRPPAGVRDHVLKASYWLPLPPRSDQTNHRVPFDLKLFWPEEATRVDSRVRIWGEAATLRVTGFEGPWGELPPVPAQGKDALPWLTLEGTGDELPLSVIIAPLDHTDLPPVNVQRALIQANVGIDEETVRIRARFRVQDWSGTGVTLILPADIPATITVGQTEISNTIPRSVPEGPTVNGQKAVLVPLPPSAEPTVVEVSYQTAMRGRTRGEVQIVPPQIWGATYQHPIRWQVTFPNAVAPLYFGNRLYSESHWVWRGPLLTPNGGLSESEMEEWFLTGRYPEISHYADANSTSVLSARQAELGPIFLYRLPWIGWVAISSLFVLVLGLGLSRLKSVLVGPMVAVIGLGACILAFLWPQPMAQLVAACQPGIAAVLVILLGQSLIRWYQKRRITYLPGFTRTRPESAISHMPPSGATTGDHLVPDRGTNGTGSQRARPDVGSAAPLEAVSSTSGRS